MVLTHPTFLEAAEFPRSDGCLFVYAKPVGNLQNTFPQNVFAVCSTGTANILEYWNFYFPQGPYYVNKCSQKYSAYSDINV